MTTENQQTATDVQRTAPLRRARHVKPPMSKRPAKGPTDQRRITLPGHIWELLDRVASLQTKAYGLMSGKTKFQVSDLLESGAEMYLRSLIDDLGPLPDEKDAAAEKRFVERLAEANKRSLLADLLGSKPDTH